MTGRGLHTDCTCTCRVCTGTQTGTTPTAFHPSMVRISLHSVCAASIFPESSSSAQCLSQVLKHFFFLDSFMVLLYVLHQHSQSRATWKKQCFPLWPHSLRVLWSLSQYIYIYIKCQLSLSPGIVRGWQGGYELIILENPPKCQPGVIPRRWECREIAFLCFNLIKYCSRPSATIRGPSQSRRP